MPYPDVVRLPEPAAHLSAQMHTYWRRGYTTYQVEGVGAFVLVPILDCPGGCRDPHGRTLPCGHVQVYMGTGGPHTQPENRKDIPAVAGRTLVGPLTSDTIPEGDLKAYNREVYLTWCAMPEEARQESAQIVKALATHWGRRPDIDEVKAAYARAQAPRRLDKAQRATEKARRLFEEAARNLDQAVAEEGHQEYLAKASSLAEAARLVSPGAPVWAEYSVRGMSSEFDDDFLLCGVYNRLGDAVDTTGGGSDGWSPYSTTLVARGWREALDEALEALDE